MDRLVRAIAANPLWVLAAVLAVTLYALTFLVDVRTGKPRLMVDPSLNRLIPDDDEDRRFYESVRQLFGSDEIVIVGLVAEPLFTHENMERVRRMTRRLESVEGVERVVSLASALDIRGEDDELRIEPFLDEIPQDAAGLERIRREALENPVYTGNLVSRDGRATALVVHVANMSEREFVERGIGAEIRSVVEEERGDAEVWITGTPVIKQETARVLLADLSVIIPLAFGLTLLVAVLSFRSVRGAVVPMTTLVLGIVWTLATMVALDRPLNLVTTIVPPLLLTVGYAYVMHLLAEYYDVARADLEAGTPGRDDIVLRSLHHVAMPIFICGLTTMVGFASLTLSPLSAIQEFGWFSVLGTLFIMLATLSFAPALLQLLPPPKLRPRREPEEKGLDRFARWMGEFDVRNRRAIFGVAGGAVALALFGITRIEVSTDLVTNFPEDFRVRRDFEAINANLDGANLFYVVVETGHPAAFQDPVNLRELRALQDWLEAQREIGSTTSIADYVRLVHRGFHGNDPAELRIPDSKRLVAQLLAFGENDEMTNFVDSRYQTASILVRSKALDSGHLAGLVGRIEERLKELPPRLRPTITGNTVLLARSIDDLAMGQATSLATGLILIYGILVVMFTSFRVGALALIPNALPVAAYFGIMGFTGVSLNATTGLVACIVLGIAVDDTIHYMHRFNAEARRHTSEARGTVLALRALGRPVTLTAIALCLGFLVLTASHLRNQIEFGWLAAVTLALGWVCEMTLTPAICSVTRIVTLWDVLSLDLGKQPQRELPIFHGLSERQARVAALMMRLQEFTKGARIFREGEAGDDMYVLIDGQLAASVSSEEGRTELAKMHRGDTVGEVALFYGQRTADVDATTDVRALRITRRDLERLRRRYPRIGTRVFWNLSEILARRVANTTLKIR